MLLVSHSVLPNNIWHSDVRCWLALPCINFPPVFLIESWIIDLEVNFLLTLFIHNWIWLCAMSIILYVWPIESTQAPAGGAHWIKTGFETWVLSYVTSSNSRMVGTFRTPGLEVCVYVCVHCGFSSLVILKNWKRNAALRSVSILSYCRIVNNPNA